MHDLPLPLDAPVDLPGGVDTLPDLPPVSGNAGAETPLGAVGGGMQGTEVGGGIDTIAGGTATGTYLANPGGFSALSLG